MIDNNCIRVFDIHEYTCIIIIITHMGFTRLPSSLFIVGSFCCVNTNRLIQACKTSGRQTMGPQHRGNSCKQ